MAVAVASFALSMSAANETTSIKRIPAHPTTAVSGPELFREYCAVCHGTEAKGDGPAAVALRVKPANLTLIAQKNGSKFPEIKVQSDPRGR